MRGVSASKGARARLAPTSSELLAHIAACEGPLVASKRELATVLGRGVNAVDRAVQELRDLGLVEVSARRGTDGGQLANSYAVREPAERKEDRHGSV